MLPVNQFKDKRVLIVLPGYILCHLCKANRCAEEVQPVKHNVENLDMTIYPPSMIGEERKSHFPEPKFKDFNLDFATSFPIQQDKGLGILGSKMTMKGAILCNGIIIDVHTREDHNRLELIIERFSQNLINSIRLITKQYWISPFVYANQNTTLKYFYEYNPKRLYMLFGQTKFVGFPTFTPCEILTDKLYKEAIAQTINDSFDFEEHKYLDGLRNFTVEQVQNAVLDITMSAEIAKNNLLEQIWAIEKPGCISQNNDYRKIGFYGNNLTQHIGGDLRKSKVGRSFMDDYPKEFALIQELWRYRCQVGHGTQKFHDDKGNEVEIDYQYFVKLAQACSLVRKYCHGVRVT